MKKYATKMVSYLMCFVLFLSMVIPASATVIPQGLKEATPEDLQRAAELEQQYAAQKMQGGIQPASTTIDKAIALTYYGQELVDSCASASTRMVLRFLTGIPYSETTVRANTGYQAGIGSSMTNVCLYLNQEQSTIGYIASYGKNETTMHDNLYTTIVNWTAPCIVGLAESIYLGFPYNGGAHAVVANGYDNTGTNVTFDIMDPWAGYIGDIESNQRYSVTISNLHAAYERTNAGYAW